VQPLDQAEAGAQRRREQAKAGRRADQREALELHRQRLRVWPIGDAHIDTKFFHRRIEKLLQCRLQPVHFIVKEDVAFLEGREHAHEIARRSRGTPRVANRLLKRVRDYAQVRAAGKITAAVAAEALKRLDVDEFGLDDMDARILKAIIEMFDGGPVGVQTVAAAVGEDPGTLEEVYEPFLMQQGFLARTPRGRVATPAAYRHFGFTPPKSTEQASIFDG